MTKLIHSFVAVAALCAGAAWAQGGADCQAGSAWGANPGCGATDQPTPIAGNSGWSPPWGYDPGNGVYAFPPLAQGFPQYRSGSSVWVDPATGAQYAVRPRRGDRDGDGIPNSRDRYPDDPRYH